MTEKDVKADNLLVLEHGKPMVFGNNGSKGIRLDGLTPMIVDLTTGEYSVNDLWIHDEKDASPVRSFMLSQFSDNPEFPTPMGVFYQTVKSTYDSDVEAQIAAVKQTKGEGTLKKLLYTSGTWTVE